ncbi:MAG: hypothetical protein MHPSP_001555 [Paramarteilia canceri]
MVTTGPTQTSSHHIKYLKTAERVAQKFGKTGIDERVPKKIIIKIDGRYIEIKEPLCVTHECGIVAVGKAQSVNPQNQKQLNQMWNAVREHSLKNNENKTTEANEESSKVPENDEQKVENDAEVTIPEGIDAENVEMVMSQAKCSKRKAIDVLVEAENDVVNALLLLN